MKKLVGRVTKEERDEIKYLFERKNGLLELINSIDNSASIYEKVVMDLGQTTIKFQNWWNRHAEMYHWDFIENGTILSEKKEKAFALYYIWIDVRIPYFELPPGLKMENEVYQDMLDKLKPMIRKARFILFTPTDQKTERASRILKVLDELEDESEKAVLMAQVLGMIDRRGIAALEMQRR